MALIAALAGLVLAFGGAAMQKGARSRAQTEIKALEAACESYKADNGSYPNNAATNLLKPNSDTDPAQSVYANASLYLYKELSGDRNADSVVNASDDLTGNGVVPRTYFAFKPGNLLPTSSSAVTAIRDPFGHSYGYSTVKNSNPAGTDGYNPTFDLWSTANKRITNVSEQSQWIKNW